MLSDFVAMSTAEFISAQREAHVWIVLVADQLKPTILKQIEKLALGTVAADVAADTSSLEDASGMIIRLKTYTQFYE